MLDQSPLSNADLIVDLCAARLPRLARFAEHCWFIVWRPNQIDRWEIWQDPNFGAESWSHLHRNLLAPFAGIGGNQAYWIRRWTDDDAVRLAARIEDSPNSYPWCQRYRYVPGPNSNTYVQWCLQDLHRLGWRAIGRGFAKHTSTPTAVTDETAL